MKKPTKKREHWTSKSVENFQARITLDFVAQLEDRIEGMPDMTKTKLARQLGVTQGAVSQKLNNPDNLELKTITKYSRALGGKVAVVFYDDGDHDNSNGPVNSEIFAACWEKQGRPTNFRDLEKIAGKNIATTERPDFTTDGTNVVYADFGRTDATPLTMADNSQTEADWQEAA